MPDSLSFTVRGVAQLERDWLALADDLGPRRARSVANTPIRRALAPVRQQIETNTPVDTGTLRNSINTNAGSARRAELRSGVFGPNVVAVGRTGWFWRGTSLWFQALAVEYGTRTLQPQSVLRDALRNNVDEVLAIFAREMGTRIEQRAERLARTGR